MSPPNPSDESEVRFWGEVEATSGDTTVNATVRDRHDIEIDEPDWESLAFGRDRAPSPVDYLCVSVASCQASVLKQCLEKSRIPDYDIHVSFERHHRVADDAPDDVPFGSTRVDDVTLDLTLSTAEKYERRASRCLDIAEDICIVGRSVEGGFDVVVDKHLELTDVE